MSPSSITVFISFILIGQPVETVYFTYLSSALSFSTSSYPERPTTASQLSQRPHFHMVLCFDDDRKVYVCITFPCLFLGFLPIESYYGIVIDFLRNEQF